MIGVGVAVTNVFFTFFRVFEVKVWIFEYLWKMADAFLEGVLILISSLQSPGLQPF